MSKTTEKKPRKRKRTKLTPKKIRALLKQAEPGARELHRQLERMFGVENASDLVLR
jgi:hypothetical protein